MLLFDDNHDDDDDNNNNNNDDDDDDDDDDGTVLIFSLFFVSKQLLKVFELSALDTSTKAKFELANNKLYSMAAEILDAVSIKVVVPVIGF